MERARVGVAPVVALLAASLGIYCATSLVSMLDQLTALDAISGRFVGWLGLGWLLAVLAMLAALLLDRWVGAGPAVAVGALAAVAGLMLGRDVSSTADLAWAAAVLGIAAGGLVGGAASVGFELAPAGARRAVVAWVLPVVAGGAVQAWVVARDETPGVHLAPEAALWLLIPLAAVLVLWGAWSLVAAPVSSVEAVGGFRDAWLSLVLTQVVLYVVVMLIGFDSHLRLYWLRPVVIIASSLALAVWLMVSVLLPNAAAKIAFLSVSFVAASVPAVEQLLFVVARTGESARVGVAALPVLVVAAVVGGGIGLVLRRRAVIGGLVVVALGCAGAWLVRGESAGWLVVLALLAGAGCAVAVGGLIVAMESPATLRLVAFASLSALVVGTGIAVPLGWALIGDLPTGHREAVATSRVLAGLVYSLAVLLAGYVTVVGRRIDRRQRSAGISEWGTGISFPGVGGAVIHGGARPEGELPGGP